MAQRVERDATRTGLKVTERINAVLTMDVPYEEKIAALKEAEEKGERELTWVIDRACKILREQGVDTLDIGKYRGGAFSSVYRMKENVRKVRDIIEEQRVVDGIWSDALE
ncbi:hypothetical protein TSH58p_17735 [Azospirillum sp. TSH58]|uniref:hypothetical protein n=1 Tax=Azospirillum sp. TSH58 TaxID=664962 RepID=UPI000D5FF88A|nr:hypothetical protein [Azospirillum sp. TSH58]AWJ82663.1 hypothetical protein TSH58p_03500 [Azospirillum sp. TSH58]AWJ85190.1 hypothetical protein TSH58p_17660 [Azospirillum sp. TSH58]AWJ85205.1 hypothetical protein TSH58p_17735 [Azospirillum sp. TSH58]